MEHPFIRVTRRARMRVLWNTLPMRPDMSVLDVGGTMFNWQFAPFVPRMTMLNLFPPPPNLPPDVRWFEGDAEEILRGLPDRSFDLVYCNSVIEHLGGFQAQLRLANEMRRVGKRMFVQTPDRRFPLEPHHMQLGVHWLPREAQIPIVRWFSGWAVTHWKKHRAPAPLAEARRRVEEISLLSESEMRQLFPGARIIVERTLGIPRSLIAVTDSLLTDS